MALKVIKNALTDTATILLYDYIGKDENGNGISGAEVAQAIYNLQDLGFKQIKLRINSGGGSVIDGYSIFSAVQNSKIKVDTYNDGLAASIAGVILMSGRKIYSQDYSLLMLHNPFMNGSTSEKDKETLDLIKNSLVTIFQNRTGLPFEELDSIMNKETWYTSAEALSKGFIDEVITTNKTVTVENSTFQIETIYNQMKSIINKKSMDKIFNHLNLSEESSEEMVIEAIKNKETELTSEIETLKEENEKLQELNEKIQAELNEINAEKEAAKEAEIVEFIENSVVKGLIKNERKDNWLNLAKADFETVKETINSIAIPAPAPAPAAPVKEPVKVLDLVKKAVNAVPNDRANWSMTDWRKNDPAGLLDMKNNMPEMFNELLSKLK